MKKNLIYGLGKSGLAVEEFYKRKGIVPLLFDDNEKTSNVKNIIFKNIKLAIVSPGISEENEFYKKLEENSVKIISELELGYQNVKGEIIAITGTNGKTTTTALIDHILKSHKKSCFIAGNIGIPLISLAGKTNKNSKIACEVSSFQLMKIKKFRPKIAIILNLAPDHLIRHKTFENYINAKCNIFKNQKKKDICILNYDDELTKNLNTRTKSKIFYFSMENQTQNKTFNGTYYFDGKIYFKIKDRIKFIMETKKVKLLGDKNIENILCAILTCLLLNFEIEKLKDAVNSFYPLPNRLEVVLSRDNTTYINDSKATNIASTLADVNAIKGDIILLLGGSDKGEDFRILFSNLLPNIKKSIIYGATCENMQKCADEVSYKNYIVCKNLEDAFYNAEETAKNLSKNKKIFILLAPACASFDEFKNYEERGDYFKKLTKIIKNN